MNLRSSAVGATLLLVAFCVLACGSGGQTTSASSAVLSRDAKAHPLAYDYKLIQSWAKKHRPGTYAGTFYRQSRSGTLVVGFIRDQGRDVEVVRHLPGIVEPSRIAAFSRQPEHSLASLEELAREFTHEFEVNESLNALVTDWTTNVQRNAVCVGSEEPNKLRQELINLYGKHAPIIVRWEERGHAT